jgi:ABC-type sugar transport system permease subunit
MPVTVGLSLVAVIFLWIMHPDFGFINYFLRNVIKLPALAQDWLGGPLALDSIIWINVWKFAGMTTIFFLAGLQAIPNSCVEAAKVDGAGSWQLLIKILIPNLKDSFLMVVIWALIYGIKLFELPFVMTKGGPANRTMVLYLYCWDNAFKFYEMGYASAIAYVTGLTIFGISLIYILLLKSERQ